VADGNHLDRSDVAGGVRVEIVGPRTVVLRDPELFESPDGTLCRAFLKRVFGLEYIVQVDISPGSREARLRVQSGGPALAEVLKGLAAALREEARGAGAERFEALYLPGRGAGRVSVQRHGPVLATWGMADTSAGEVRLTHPAIEGCEWRADLAGQRLRAVPGVLDASARPSTGEVLLQVDARRLARDELLAAAEASLFAQPPPPPDTAESRDGLRPRDRMLLAALLAVFVYVVTPSSITQESRALLAWNAGAILLLAMVGTMMLRSDAQQTSERSQTESSYLALLVVVVLTAGFGLAGTAAMLGETRRMAPLASQVHLVLSASTVATAWLIVHLYFALRYARVYYDKRPDDGRRPFAAGLAFPETKRIDYLDFIYYSFTIAMCFQTSDVPVESRPMRRLTIAHSVVSFFFVIAILGLVVNIASSLV